MLVYPHTQNQGTTPLRLIRLNISIDEATSYLQTLQQTTYNYSYHECNSSQSSRQQNQKKKFWKKFRKNLDNWLKQIFTINIPYIGASDSRKYISELFTTAFGHPHNLSHSKLANYCESISSIYIHIHKSHVFWELHRFLFDGLFIVTNSIEKFSSFPSPALS
jgi:hypothetical protein